MENSWIPASIHQYFSEEKKKKKKMNTFCVCKDEHLEIERVNKEHYDDIISLAVDDLLTMLKFEQCNLRACKSH